MKLCLKGSKQGGKGLLIMLLNRVILFTQQENKL